MRVSGSTDLVSWARRSAVSNAAGSARYSPPRRRTALGRHPLLRQLKGSVKVERGCDQGLRGLVEHVGHGAAEKSRYSGVLACEDFEGRYRLEVLLDVVLPHLRKEVTTRRKDAT